MKIDRLPSSASRPSIDSTSSNSRVQKNAVQAPAVSSTSSVTHIQRDASDAQDIDMARVAEIRQAISEGRFEISSERIAKGLLNSVQELLGPR